MQSRDQSPSKSSLDEPELITRFSIALMAFTLMGMGVGSALPQRFGALTLGTGVIGFMAYGVCEVVARRQRRETIEQVRSRAEDRLTRQFNISEEKSQGQHLISQPDEAVRFGRITIAEAPGSAGPRASVADSRPGAVCDERR